MCCTAAWGIRIELKPVGRIAAKAHGPLRFLAVAAESAEKKEEEESNGRNPRKSSYKAQRR